MRILEINNIDESDELEKVNFSNPYILRKFKTNSIEIVKSLIEKYHNDLAFGLIYNNRNYTVFKNTDDGNIYVRNNNKFGFNSLKHMPSITSVNSFVGFTKESVDFIEGIIC